LTPGRTLIGSGVFDRWSIWAAGEKIADEPLFVRAVTARSLLPVNQQYQKGIKWAPAWDVELAQAAETLAAQVMIDRSSQLPHECLSD